MLAKNNLDIEGAVVTLHELSDDEKIKLQCEARERYEWDMASAIAKGKREGEEIGLRKGKEAGLREGKVAGLREGEEIGLRKGEDRLLKLIQCLTNDNQTELIPKITADSDYREELYQKYGL